MKTSGLKNFNILTKDQYDSITEHPDDELWAVEVKTYIDNDGNWYRIYPDGWCEQGGGLGTRRGLSGNIFYINLMVPMKAYNYTAYVQVSHGSSDAGAYWARVLNDRTSTVLKYYMYLNNSVTTNNPNVSWYVCGYIA